MDPHVIFTIGEYSFRRVATGWFIRLLGIGCAVILYIIFFMGGPKAQEALVGSQSWNATIIHTTALLLVVIMGATEIPRDIETRTILVILSKPLTKNDIVLGKYVGLVYVAFFSVFVLGSVALLGGVVKAMLNGVAIQGQINFIQKCLFSTCQAAVVAAVVIFLSTRLSEIPIIFFSAFYIAIGSFIGYLQAILMIETIPLAAWVALKAIYFFAPNFLFFQILPPEKANVTTVGWDHMGIVALYACVWAAIFLVLALRSFDKREVAG